MKYIKNTINKEQKKNTSVKKSKNNLIPFAGILIQFYKQIKSIAILEQAFSIFLHTRMQHSL